MAAFVEGVTVREHVEQQMAEANALIIGVLRVVRTERRPPKARRERLQRDLAGVQASCETVKLWLAKGCPEVSPPAALQRMREEDVPLPFEPAVETAGALPEPPVSWS